MRMQALGQRPRLCNKVGDPADLAVGHRNIKALLGKVQRQSTAHHTKPVYTDIRAHRQHSPDRAAILLDKTPSASI